ncbi:hypothetical protein PFICI_07456 [Pestalotiopsis fici W106-1]|uniref:Uncharacterized protein n=1 Tax=Pestalotiopsis fici (strain W106-1 / CGMCC3.15140) TaxID=1229662 RepID=W3X3F1_PESFW|nr:uncharacterized protein PFICI_07456 [Pestalotiopsis fici W106-1]ETS79927.1 hypothetical protein PFICI_07456 [Pestalotiopsis fici W106-1]
MPNYKYGWHPQRPAAPVLRRNGFEMRGREFGPTQTTARREPRIDGSRLLELFFPGRLRSLRGQEEARESARDLFKMTFFVAQLRWYGIPFRSSARLPELQQLLRDAVVDGRCEQVPASVLKLELDMRRDHEPALKAWDQEVEDWEAEQESKENQAWFKYSNPAERAKQDLHRFMEHYFLTNGRPDESKTPEPMALYGYDDRHLLRAAAERVPGLETWSGGTGSMRTICIGWNRSAVISLARHVDRQSSRQEAERSDNLWLTAMKDHDRLVQQVRKEGPRVQTRSIEPPTLQKCRGSYVIRCEEVSGQWPSMAPFTLDVSRGVAPSISAGRLDMGYFDGTMLIALSNDRLEDYIQAQDESDTEDDDSDGHRYSDSGSDSHIDGDSNHRRSDSDSHSDAASSDSHGRRDNNNNNSHRDSDSDSRSDSNRQSYSSDSDSQNDSNRRSYSDSHSDDDDERRTEDYDRYSDSDSDDDHKEEETKSYNRLGSKRKRGPTRAEPTHSKRHRGRSPKETKAPAHRVFIRLRGRETGEGEIQPDPVSGHLDFSDENFTRFVGMIDLPLLCGSVKLEGFKVSATARHRYEPWSTFSEAAYEDARVARWR